MFYVKVTAAGAAKIAAAIQAQTPIQIAQFAVGDANGAYYEPTGNEVALVHEVWRAAPNRVYTHPNNANWVVVEAIIPASQGGFDVREAAAFATDGTMIAVGKYPLTNKPAPGSGSEKDLYVRLIMQVTNTAAVQQLIDPSLIMATQEYVDRKNVREACRVVTTANVVLSGLQTIDGVVLAENDRVLVKAQNTGSQNGIYVAKAAAWTRALDADNALEIVDTMLVPVREGTANGDTIWMLATNAPITVGTTALTFIRIYPDESSRTISDAVAPTGDAGAPTTLFGWLANMVKTITGKANWRTAPATNLEAAKAHMDATAPHAGHVSHSLATAANDFLVAPAAGSFIKKTLAEVKVILGLGNAAYKNIGTAAGTVAAGDHGHVGVYEPVIAAGTAAHYWRGDKTWEAMPTSLPASDVYAWAKAATKPSYTKAEVGLANVDNTADAVKSVSYANSAGSAPASDVYAWAKAATKPSYTKAEVGLANVDNTADAVKSVNYANSAGWAQASDVYPWAKAAAKPAYTKAEVGLANVDNTADAVKSVNYANSAGNGCIFTGTAPLYACRAWVSFNGTGVVAIQASGNVSSITDNGAGDYGVNFIEPMPDANYVAAGGGSHTASGLTPVFPKSGVAYPFTTTTALIRSVWGTGTADITLVTVAFFR